MDFAKKRWSIPPISDHESSPVHGLSGHGFAHPSLSELGAISPTWRNIDTRLRSLSLRAGSRELPRLGRGQLVRGAARVRRRRAASGGGQRGARACHRSAPERGALSASSSHHRESGSGRRPERGECLRSTHRSREGLNNPHLGRNAIGCGSKIRFEDLSER